MLLIGLLIAPHASAPPATHSAKPAQFTRVAFPVVLNTPPPHFTKFQHYINEDDDDKSRDRARSYSSRRCRFACARPFPSAAMRCACCAACAACCAAVLSAGGEGGASIGQRSSSSAHAMCAHSCGSPSHPLEHTCPSMERKAAGQYGK